MNWNLWIRQTWTIARVELKRHVLAKRWAGIYLLVLAPILLLSIAAWQTRRPPRIEGFTGAYAVFFQTFMLRFAVFFSCALVFSQLFRGEILEKTLHFYLLTPVRREVIAAGKYLAGVAAMSLLFGFCTVATNILVYVPNPAYPAFFLEGNGLAFLGRYLAVTVLACVTYGAVFLLCGLLFKNPAPSALTLLAWEAFYFVLPASLQKFTVMHYLQSMLPIVIDRGPFAVVVDPTPPWLGVPVLLLTAGAFVFASGRRLRHAQVTYSAD